MPPTQNTVCNLAFCSNAVLNVAVSALLCFTTCCQCYFSSGNVFQHCLGKTSHHCYSIEVSDLSLSIGRVHRSFIWYTKKVHLINQVSYRNHDIDFTLLEQVMCWYNSGFALKSWNTRNVGQLLYWNTGNILNTTIAHDTLTHDTITISNPKTNITHD